MYIVVCENQEGEPNLLGPFDSSEDAQWFIDSIPNDPEHSCPNDHYWLETIPIALPANRD